VLAGADHALARDEKHASRVSRRGLRDSYEASASWAGERAPGTPGETARVA